MTTTAPALMTGPDAASYLAISDRTLRRLVADREILPLFLRGSNRPRYRVADLDAYVDRIAAAS
jgi:excisionase family DNA binding protein